MSKNTGMIVAISFVVICLIAGLAIFGFDRSKSNDSSSSSSPSVVNNSQEFNSGSISEFNGKNGKKCYVAVDGKVYDMSNFSLWRNGVHTSSNGQATCGNELSSVMSKSPHGKSKLSIMPQVGLYK